MTTHRSTLPPGWTSATVDDVGEFINGLAFKPSDWEASGRPIIRIQNLTGKNEAFNLTTRAVSDDFIVRDGDILVSWSATLDVFVWRGPEAVLNQHIFKVVPVPAMADHVFVRWALKNAIGEMWLSEHTHGTTMRHINRGPFLAHSVALPPSPEQTRIADALESYLSRLDAAVANLESAQKKLKAYRASVLRAAVEGRLVPTEATLARTQVRDYEPAEVLLKRILVERRRCWEEAELAKMKAAGKSPRDDKWKAKYLEPEPPDTKGLPELPEGWCWASVDEVGDVLLGRQRAPQYLTGRWSHPYLRVANIKDDRVDFGDVEVMDFDDVHFEKYRLESGDILVSEGQSPHLVGQSAIYRGGIDGLCFQKTLHRFRPIGCGPDSEFAQLVFRAHVRMRVFQNVASITTNIAHLTLEKFKQSRFPLPPIAEQERILSEAQRYLSLADAVEDQVGVELKRIARLRQAVLKWAFEGKLVDQDPNDEPAEKLLERIRAERAGAVPPKRTRRARNGQ